MLTDDRGAVLDQVAVFGAKSGGEMAVDIEFSCHFTLDVHGDNNFRLGLERTGQIAGIRIDIVHNDGIPGGGCRPAEPATA